MLNPKLRAYLRSLAHPLKACFQIGKEGLSENLRTDVLHYLNKHELIKISILNNSFTTPAEVVEYFAEEEIEFVQHIGRVLVFYKHSDNIDNPIVLPIKK